MTQYGLDTFSRANQAGWGTATDGQTWTLVRSNQTLSIASNEGLMTYNGSTTSGIVQLGSTTVGDGEYLVRCSQSGNTADEMGICVRFKDANNVYKFSQGATAGHFQFIKDVAGAFTVVADSTFTSVVGTFYWIRARVIGTSFWGRIWQDGTAEPITWNIGALGATDSALAAPGGFGLVGAPRSGDHVSFDNFFAFDYANSDDLSVSDSFSTSGGYTGSDALSASDSLLGGASALLEDDLVASDAITNASAFQPVDALIVSDALLGSAGASMVDGLSVADAFLNGGTFIPTDALSASDVLSNTSAFLPVDALSVSDSLTSSLQAAFTDVLPVSDQLSTTLIAQFVDALMAADSLSVTNPPAQPALPTLIVPAVFRSGIVQATFRSGEQQALFRSGEVVAGGR